MSQTIPFRDTVTMPRIVCPYCHTTSHATERARSAVIASTEPLLGSAAFQCDHCHHLLIATAPLDRVGSTEPEYVSSALNKVNESIWQWEPKTVGGKDYADVPPEISGPASEAHSCLSIGANRAAVLLARAVIEAGAKDKGIGSGNLYDKITKLADQNFIRPLIADAAHEIRLLGNDMAHGDFATTEVTYDEAAEVLDLLDVFIAEAYELPGKLKRRKEARSTSSS